MLPDDPIISRAMRYGPPEDEPPRCPICGDECQTVYKDKCGDIVGCDECLTACDAYEEEACNATGGIDW